MRFLLLLGGVLVEGWGVRGVGVSVAVHVCDEKVGQPCFYF